MSTGSHAPDAHADEHGVEEHGHDGHGNDAHGDDEPAVGPVDVPAWAAAIGGILIGVAVAFCFALATAPA
jgi:hypothetical protein